ncbi:hypothetical protein J6590_062219 [Homalodisca vitripennis]|nr:hypothetical protein J6590_062219 [Homalodisca vitripennis]
MSVDNGYLHQKDIHYSTKAIHVGSEPEQWNCMSVVPPISLSTTFKQEGPAQFKQYEYSRSGNPNRTCLQRCLAALDDAKHGLCFSSGLGATTALVSLLQAGDHILSVDDIYGGTGSQSEEVLRKHGTVHHVGVTILVKDWKSESEKVQKKQNLWHFKFNPSKRIILLAKHFGEDWRSHEMLKFYCDLVNLEAEGHSNEEDENIIVDEEIDIEIVYFRHIAARFNIATSFVCALDPEKFCSQIQPNTKMIWMESPTNPLMKIFDIPRLVSLVKAQNKDIIFLVDNTFLTSYYQGTRHPEKILLSTNPPHRCGKYQKYIQETKAKEQDTEGLLSSFAPVNVTCDEAASRVNFWIELLCCLKSQFPSQELVDYSVGRDSVCPTRDEWPSSAQDSV